MDRFLRLSTIALSLTVYSVLAPFGYFAFWIWGMLPTKDRDRRARRMQWITRKAFTGLYHWARLIRAYKLKAPVLESDLPDGPCVIVANHPTLLDAATMIRCIPNMTLSVKPSYYRIRALRPMLDVAAHFEGSDSPATLPKLIDSAIDRLERGFRVVMLPEGTRSPTGGLRPFGRVAFEVACRANVPVVPLLIEMKPVWLNHDVGFFQPPSETPEIYVTPLDPIYPETHNGSSRALRDAVWTALSNRLGGPALPAPTATDQDS